MAEPEHDPAAHWESAAQAWIAWTGRPDHDAFWAYREGFRAFVPPPGRATLEIGCGEGRIARELADLGHSVTALEITPTLLGAARDARSARHYVRGDAEHLPFATDAFDQVVAYNMLMDVADMPAAVAEIGRVLRPGGAATISIVHPFVDRGRFVDARDGDGDALVVDVPYLGRRHFTTTEERDGLAMPFAGWSRPLSDYVAAVRDAGLAVADLAEPVPDPGIGNRKDRWNRFPLFCWIEARPLG